MVNSRKIKLGATKVENGIVNVSLSVLVNVNGEENKLMLFRSKGRDFDFICEHFKCLRQPGRGSVVLHSWISHHKSRDWC